MFRQGSSRRLLELDIDGSKDNNVAYHVKIIADKIYFLNPRLFIDHNIIIILNSMGSISIQNLLAFGEIVDVLDKIDAKYFSEEHFNYLIAEPRKLQEIAHLIKFLFQSKKELIDQFHFERFLRLKTTLEPKVLSILYISFQQLIKKDLALLSRANLNEILRVAKEGGSIIEKTRSIILEYEEQENLNKIGLGEERSIGSKEFSLPLSPAYHAQELIGMLIRENRFVFEGNKNTLEKSLKDLGRNAKSIRFVFIHFRTVNTALINMNNFITIVDLQNNIEALLDLVRFLRSKKYANLIHQSNLERFINLKEKIYDLLKILKFLEEKTPNVLTQAILEYEIAQIIAPRQIEIEVRRPSFFNALIISRRRTTVVNFPIEKLELADNVPVRKPSCTIL